MNIKVTPEGKVKVLDFGLAKALMGDGADVNLSQSPTLSLAATQQGGILGTAAYMSPEQARGQEVDKRADIWAFGCVLYEMMAGDAAFPGTDVTDILAAVVRAEPPWGRLPVGVSPRLQELLERCLEKDARNRWHDIADVRVDIDKLRANPHDSGDRMQSGTQREAFRRLNWVIAFALGVLVAGIATWSFIPDSQSRPRTVRFSYEVPLGANQGIMSQVDGRVAISPDGERVAYVQTQPVTPEEGEPVRQIFVRSMADAEPTPLAGTEGAQDLFFSPNGAWLGFVAGGRLRRVPVRGGAPLDIAAVGNNVFGADWGPDDNIVFGGGIPAGLFQISLDGGIPIPLTVPDAASGEISHGTPEILPDGRTVLFAIGTKDGSRIAQLSLDTGQWSDLGLSGSMPQYLSSGHLAFTQNGNLRLVSFDLGNLQIGNQVQPVLDGIEAGNGAGLELASFELSRTGDLIYVPGTLGFDTRPVWVDENGKETPTDAPSGMYIGAHLSPDGNRFATARTDAQGIGKIWVMNRDGAEAFPVGGDQIEYNPAWRPDGSTLTYTVDGNIFERQIDADVEATVLLRRENYQMPRSWSPDGRALAFREVSAEGSRLWILPQEGEPVSLTDATFDAGSPRFSPEGDWIAYSSDETGKTEVYVRRYPGTERPRQVSKRAGQEPVWSDDGRQLYYRSGDRMMAVQIETGTEVRFGDPVELWRHPYFSQEGRYPNYDVDRNGRFLMLALPDAEKTETMVINVVLGWSEELKALVPVQ